MAPAANLGLVTSGGWRCRRSGLKDSREPLILIGEREREREKETERQRERERERERERQRETDRERERERERDQLPKRSAAAYSKGCVVVASYARDHVASITPYTITPYLRRVDSVGLVGHVCHTASTHRAPEALLSPRPFSSPRHFRIRIAASLMMREGGA
eukprot:scaffold1527_cov143-Pinguiococcus_pyrenoidosus.AAC.2